MKLFLALVLTAALAPSCRALGENDSIAKAAAEQAAVQYEQFLKDLLPAYSGKLRTLQTDFARFRTESGVDAHISARHSDDIREYVRSKWNDFQAAQPALGFDQWHLITGAQSSLKEIQWPQEKAAMARRSLELQARMQTVAEFNSAPMKLDWTLAGIRKGDSLAHHNFNDALRDASEAGIRVPSALTSNLRVAASRVSVYSHLSRALESINSRERFGAEDNLKWAEEAGGAAGLDASAAVAKLRQCASLSLACSLSDADIADRTRDRQEAMRHVQEYLQRIGPLVP
ncbi:MAG: hypothetical protein HY078_17350 [Elusimicrobia bacterium]|nr:hypothetical protein [Elusimicrobiota bacterium]